MSPQAIHEAQDALKAIFFVSKCQIDLYDRLRDVRP